VRIGVGLRLMSSTTQVSSQAKCEPSVPKGRGVDAVFHLAGNGLELAELVVIGGRFNPRTLGPDPLRNRGLDANAIMHGPANDLLDDLATGGRLGRPPGPRVARVQPRGGAAGRERLRVEHGQMGDHDRRMSPLADALVRSPRAPPGPLAEPCQDASTNNERRKKVGLEQYNMMLFQTAEDLDRADGGGRC
jgi:hypothetical protein